MNKKKSIIGFFQDPQLAILIRQMQKLLNRFSKIIGLENYLLVGVDLKK